jgi:predicted ATPase
LLFVSTGKFSDAVQLLGSATKGKLSEAEANRVAGEIALKSPQPDVKKAQAYLERALTVARQQQAKSWELRAAISLARLWRDQGKVQQARPEDLLKYGLIPEFVGRLPEGSA